MADIPESTKMDAVDILKTYADFIRNDVRADDFERHPYLPHIEQTIEDLRAAPPAMDHSEVVSTLRQYINDLRYPPSADSAERRIAAAERAIAKVISASQECGQ